MILNLYYISCTYVKPMNCMVLGNKQYNTGGHRTNLRQKNPLFLFKFDIYHICSDFIINISNFKVSIHHVCFVYLFVWGFYVPLIFQSYENVTITGEGLQTLTYTRHSWP